MKIIQDKIEMRGDVVEVCLKGKWKNNVKKHYVKKEKKKKKNNINIRKEKVNLWFKLKSIYE